MANLAGIASDVADLVLDLNAKVTAQIEPQIREAQKEIEEDHGFLAMQQIHQFTTVADMRGPYPTPERYLRARTDARPILIDGIGATIQMDWMMAFTDQTVLYSKDPIEIGRPRNLVENLEDFEVFPLPDQLSPSGTISSDGNWIIEVPYFQRQPTLQNTGSPVLTNWFTENTDQYLVYSAAARVMAFNRDWEEASLNAALASDFRNRAIKEDKKRRLSRMRLMRPQRGARGSAYQFRGIR